MIQMIYPVNIGLPFSSQQIELLMHILLKEVGMNIIADFAFLVL
jgi:hypothetical protein